MTDETRELLREAADAISTTWAEKMARASREGLPDAIVQVEVDNAAPLRALATRLRAAADEGEGEDAKRLDTLNGLIAGGGLLGGERLLFLRVPDGVMQSNDIRAFADAAREVPDVG